MSLSVGRSSVAFALTLFTAVGAAAQQQNGPTPPGTSSRVQAAAAIVAPTLPPGYVIGAADVLSVAFWRDKDMSADVVVRPDGKISLPLLNDVQAAGYTPEELRARLVEAAGKYLEDPNATVVVKEIHSQNVFITGNVNKPSTYALTTGMNVLQLIALAGGLQDYADAKNIVIIRAEGGSQHYLRFNYKDVLKEKNTQQNILLKPGDTVVIP